ncbi:glycosyltransferase [Ilumatobacter sp.]|uniref:glycosyltransferase n=1 Tax=Ilumatobacter sp. TaxID=1967498 RepID=UPI0032971637
MLDDGLQQARTDDRTDLDGAGAIGYYVHHHGAGHVARYRKIVEASGDRFVPISELTLPGGLRLPPDVVSHGTDESADGALHWAPVGDHGSARRSRIFGDWLDDARPRGVVIDVSVEAALLCRLFGVATVVVRQHGVRTDGPHLMAYRSARRLLAPFPSELEHRDTPAWVTRKTEYAGFIGGGPHGPTTPPPAPSSNPGPDDVVVLWGTGGGQLSPDDAAGIVRAAGPGRVWFAGREGSRFASLGIVDCGWVADVASLLRSSPTVVASAGNNVVADAAFARCALVVVPQQRPFDEQVRHAESLDTAHAAAVVTVDGDTDWGRAIDVARHRRGTLAQMAGSGGAASAAGVIRESFAHVASR